MKKLVIAFSAVVVILLVIGFLSLRSGGMMFDLLADDFYKWPIEKQVAEATVIARATWRVEGDDYKCIVAEVIKKAPDAVFNYAPGEEFQRGNKRARPNVTYGDGQVIFFTGVPPTLRYITAVKEGRLIGLTDTTLETLRAAVQQQQPR